ncbi:vitamin K epoxide reductase family protein [Natronoglycomyces albus]|uniref:Vitamin K epoxide reductase family protein n=1 Tax=Natronoglycomyces albus TaxID=2811108 RepID=A0A895XPX0_9ACTN|nr:vitamin K epoxide reductase family protein [Natronoglycomyces albus]QSB04586.1 vitamin K epoxide reductase family protein [Natronoglycomyces albus]
MTTSNADRSVSSFPDPLRARWVTGLVLALGGVVGLAGSFGLTYERFEMLMNPEHVLGCDINPLLSCGSVMETNQAMLFGFPNPLVGLMTFPVVVVFGVALLAGARFPLWMWRGLWVGALGGIVFIHWLIYQSVFNIGVLCPYCMVVWTAMLPTFWFLTVFNLKNNVFPVSRGWRGPVDDLLRFHWLGLVLWVGLIVGLIGIEFWFYWSTLF